MKTLHGISFVLVIVGGLNWLLVGLLSWDVGMIFGGQGAIISRIIYILVGLSAIYLMFGCKCCLSKGCSSCKVEAPAQSNPQM